MSARPPPPPAATARSPRETSPAHVTLAMPPPKSRMLQVIEQQRFEMLRRRLSFSDVVRGTSGAWHVKRFLYAWTVVVVLLGLGMLGLGLYLLYFQDNVHIAPAFAYYVATFTGLALALLAVLGLYGLLQQRRCVTEGRRNYALGAYFLLSLTGSAVIIMGGIVALTLLSVVQSAETDAFALERVRVFETAVVTNLHAYVQRDRGGWRSIQQRLECCGYTSAPMLSARSATPWDKSFLVMVHDINAVAGKHCAKSATECTTTTTTTGNANSVAELPCPAIGRSWCRSEFYALMQHNYKLLGVCALVVGAAQVVASSLALFTLLCDVRMLRPRSPERALPPGRRPLSPVGARPTQMPPLRAASNRSTRHK